VWTASSSRGQVEGSVRSDLPRSWLVTTFYSLMHAAAEEVDSGRLPQAAAADALQATLLAAFAPPRPRSKGRADRAHS
jgi:TetR/AcrR family transcriptional repressor of mexCD-oprJ operon